MKPTINISHVNFWDWLLQDVSISINDHHIVWLIGENGCGKTTLAKLISKKLKPISWYINSSHTVTYVTQNLITHGTVTIASYLHNWLESRETYRADEVLEQVWLWKINRKQLVDHLSWWQKTRLTIARWLLHQTKIMILDEPSNHLDIEWIEWLSQRMYTFDGLIVLISHDRALLDEVCDWVIGKIWLTRHIVDWGYTDWIEFEDSYRENRAVDLANRNKRRQQLINQIKEFQRRSQISDSPMWWSLIRARQKLLERFESTSKPYVAPMHKPNISFVWTDIERLLIKLHAITLYKPTTRHPLIKNFTASVHGGQKILISWPNGSWKSTLLSYILSKSEWVDVRTEKYIYIDQHYSLLNNDRKIYDVVNHLAKHRYRAEHEIKAVIFSAWISKEMLWSRVNELSRWQKSRLIMAIVSQANYDLIILDEPTNHCDISTREVLEKALQNYEWALLLVSHDRYFIQQLRFDEERVLGEKVKMKRSL